MASPLRIPPRYLGGLTAIGNLTSGEVDALCGVFDQVPERLTASRLASHFREAVPKEGIDPEQLLEAVISLVPLLPEDASGSDQLAMDVSESPDLELSATQRTLLKDHLVKLMGLRALELAARARQLVTEHEHVFHDARVLTDIRPVFGADVADGVQAATIVATLKIEFHPDSGADLDAAFFALDKRDLRVLQGAIERALKKTASLEALLSESAIPYWEYREVDDA